MKSEVINMAFPIQLLWLFVAAMVISSIGFKNYVWFISLGYGFSIAGEGVLMLILYGQSLQVGTILCSALFIVLVWFVACIVTYAVYPVVSRLMATISPGFEPAGPGLLVLASLALCLVFSLIHIWLIRSKIRH